jgi:hypothetical protein
MDTALSVLAVFKSNLDHRTPPLPLDDNACIRAATPGTTPKMVARSTSTYETTA